MSTHEYDQNLLDLVDWGSAFKSLSSDVDCVEVAPGGGVIGFQDSKQEGEPGRDRLVVGVAAGRVLLDAIKAGEYDL